MSITLVVGQYTQTLQQRRFRNDFEVLIFVVKNVITCDDV
jgi:hypothetical protein